MSHQQLASDNYAGICPEVMDLIQQANVAHEPSYGTDPWTTQAADAIRNLFEFACEVYFVFNGTAANSLALAALCQSYHSIIAHEVAHIETDECGATEFFSNGSKILLTEGRAGKLTPATIEQLVIKRTDIHYPKPKVVSLTQPTEVGTVYTREELLDIRNMADKYDLRIHMDGARFANAVASLGVTPKEISWQCGVDVLCFGGTKNGMPFGEAIVFFDKALAADFDYRCKQAGQLASKMRYLSAPWLGLLQNEVWLKNARHANKCAAFLEEHLRDIPGLEILFPRQVNSVFVAMPPALIEALHRKGWQFYTFIGAGGCRLMCAWDTEISMLEQFVADVQLEIEELPIAKNVVRPNKGDIHALQS